MSTWSKPASGSVKVNVKGFFHRAQMRAAVGCVMRDSHGIWIKGCKSMIGLEVPITAELWSLFYGLKLAWENEEKSVVLESECAEAVNQVLNPDPSFDMYDLVCLIRQLMNESWDVCDIVIVGTSANLVAAALANSAISDHGAIINLSQAPASLRSILAADRMA